MGIRVHKVYGWGIDDLEPNDVRANLDPDQIEAIQDKADTPERMQQLLMDNLGDVIAFVEAVHGIDADARSSHLITKLMIKENKPTSGAFSLLHHNAEFGIPSVLLLSDWRGKNQRYNDTLDWVSETTLFGKESHVSPVEVPPTSMEHWYTSTVPMPESLVKKGIAPEQANSIRQEVYEWLHDAYYDAGVIEIGPESEFVSNLYRVVPVEILISLWLYRSLFTDPIAFGRSIQPFHYVWWG